MVSQARQITSFKASLARKFLRGGALAVFGLFMPYQVVWAQTSTSPKADTDSAAKSLESVLQRAAEEGFLVARPAKEIPKAGDAPTRSATTSPIPSSINHQGKAEPTGDCGLVKNVNIIDAAKVETLEDINTAKAKLGHDETTEADMDRLILSYLALGLGNEAEALSERLEKPLPAALARVVSNEATEQDAKMISRFRNCEASFKVWDVAASIAQLGGLTPPRTITVAEFTALSKFPLHLRQQIDMSFAIYSAEMGDFFNAERILKDYFPNTKYGELPSRKDEDVLYLYALVLQHKKDMRFAEILTHLAASQGQFKTKAIQALAQDNLNTGRALPESFESDLTAIDEQYGDSQEGRAASLELIRYRADKSQLNDAINTAKLKFPETDPFRVESVNLIGEKIIEGLNTAQTNRQIYALNGYFHDPEFFVPFSKLAELTLQVHDGAMNLGMPELAQKLAPKLESFAADTARSDINNRLMLARAKLDIKNAQYAQAIETLEPIKSTDAAIALTQKASLASDDRDLVQRVFSEQPKSETMNAEYLEFILQKGQWAEAKLFASNLTAAKAPKQGGADTAAQKLPFSFSMETLNYLAAPLTANTKIILPESTADLDEMLKVIKSNTQVAKGLLNYAPTDK